MDCIHDGQKVPDGNSDMLRRWCGSGRRSSVWWGGTGAGDLKRQRVADLTALEPEEEEPILKVPEPEAP